MKTVAVLGSGIMGRGIAHVSALGGFRVVLYDVEPKILDQALVTIRSNMQKGVDLGKLQGQEMNKALESIRLTTRLEEAASEAQFVIEAAPEKIDLKVRIFADLDRLCSPDTVLATNTSGLSITEIAAATNRPDRVIGMHFFNPVHLMKLVEIIRALQTSDSTYQTTEEVSRKMGKETVEVTESPGFVTSRINALIGNEAFYMLEAGVASPRDIDKAIKLGLNHPMGPLEMADLVGLDTRLSVLTYLHETLGEKYRPCPLMIKYVKAGRLGRKVGRGVYEYPQEKKS
ncbi:MAG TPA: 3-hydroxyacyl-CoA dehydrogenase [bacterium]|nr:3-hydroxyacyl-CoA dehydrogenase [bacterium]